MFPLPSLIFWWDIHLSAEGILFGFFLFGGLQEGLLLSLGISFLSAEEWETNISERVGLERVIDGLMASSKLARAGALLESRLSLS